VGLFESRGGVVEPVHAQALGEFKHEPIRDGESCQQHGLSIIRLRRLSCDRRDRAVRGRRA
jgi:hypothetical protein